MFIYADVYNMLSTSIPHKAENIRTESNNYICFLVFILYKLQLQSWETHHVLLDPIRTLYIEVGEQN